MATSILDMTPYIPGYGALEKSDLPDKVTVLAKLSARLSGQIHPITLERLEGHMAVINSYYSNLIEGNATSPLEIRAAQRGDYSHDPAKRDLQEESLAHMVVQERLRRQQPDLDTIFSPDFIREIHQQFYQLIPESLWEIRDEAGLSTDKVVPGQWRTQPVKIGRHIPPPAEDIAGLMSGYCDTYNEGKYRGDRKIIAIMAAHHRFAWIHPFADGNGRVGRLLTDVALKTAGLDSYGAWSMSRGLARSSTRYKDLLAGADIPRQGTYDGRGQLTENGLMRFCNYMLDTANDQVSYISDLLDLNELSARIDSYIQARNDNRVTGITTGLKANASLVLHNAFIYGELERARAIDLCRMPERSARRLLRQLRDEGLLSETSSKSPFRWEIPEHAEPWYLPQLTPQI